MLLLKFFKWFLLPLGILHLIVIKLRSKLYDWNILKVYHLPHPVISVGNIQMGGTGKTPMVLELVNLLQESQKRVGVLTRGYKGNSQDGLIALSHPPMGNKLTPRQIGDEPYMILTKLQNGILGVGADRHHIGEKLSQKHSLDVFVMDDGFQHRRLHRNLNICMIDVSRWTFHPFLFPFSYLRDYKGALKKADMIILTKADGFAKEEAALTHFLKKKYHIPILKGKYGARYLTQFNNGLILAPEELEGKKIIAVCGVANPEYFFYCLRELQCQIIKQKRYPDHYRYTIRDLLKIEQEAKEKKIDWIMTTEKDEVKIRECLLKKDLEVKQKILTLNISIQLDNQEYLIEQLEKLFL